MWTNLLENPNPNPKMAALICAVKQCSQDRDLAKGRLVHRHILARAHNPSTVLYNWLVHMYGDCGSMDDAAAVFERIPNPNLYSWTMLMRGYVRNGRGGEALECFRRMQMSGLKPDPVAYVCSLEACTDSETLAEVRRLHGEIREAGFEGQIVVGTALISTYGKCGSIGDSRNVFSGMPRRNTVSWNAMIAVFAQNGYCKEAVFLFNWMQCEGFRPNEVTFVSALDACAGMAALAEGQNIHAAATGCGYENNVEVATALVNMYGKCGSLEEAMSVFGHMRFRNVVSWNAMISAYTQNGDFKAALKLFRCMQSEGVKPDHITFVCTLDACGSLADLEEGKKIHLMAVECGYDRHVGVGPALISMYGKCKDVENSQVIFAQLPRRNLVCWNSMLAAFAQNRRGAEALKLFNQMQLAGVKPDQITFVSALDACTALGALKKGQDIHAMVLEKGFEGEVTIGNTLINMYGKCGVLMQARDVFAKMPYRNAVSWNAIITACAQNGHGKEALELFHQMQSNNIKPNHITFLSILTACSHSGHTNDAVHLFRSMTEHHGFEQKMEHYVSLLDALGRAGDLNIAEELINQTPFENKAKLWLCLLGACRLHGDVDRAMRAASNVLKLDPANAVAYVLLSNIYAEANAFMQHKSDMMTDSG